MKKISLRARCLCGSIKIKTQGYHRNVHNCHCIQCMKTHGHYAAYTNVEEQNIKFIKNACPTFIAKSSFCSFRGLKPFQCFFFKKFNIL